MRVCLGGTFDRIHAGHRKLLEKSFQLGDYVYIGLTTDKFARNKGRQIRAFGQRKAQLEGLIRSQFPAKSWDVMPLSDKYGPSINGDFDAIVVSPATEPTAKEINHLRLRKGLPPLHIVVVPFLLAEDGLPISSRRIALGEIDEEGRLLTKGRPELHKEG